MNESVKSKSRGVSIINPLSDSDIEPVQVQYVVEAKSPFELARRATEGNSEEDIGDSKISYTNQWTTNNSLLYEKLQENATSAINEINSEPAGHREIIDTIQGRFSASPSQLEDNMI